MDELTTQKVGIVACSGEEIAEGTVTRLAALKVLEQLRPQDTVTICLPLFLAGGEGDRAFARFYPTIAIDGCEQRCAARATEMYSSKPAATVVVTELVAQNRLTRPEGRRRLNEAGQEAVRLTAARVAELVDELLDRPAGYGSEAEAGEVSATNGATCSCGSGIPIQKVVLNGETIPLVGLPLIFSQFRNQGKQPSLVTAQQLLTTVQVYNPIPAEQEQDYLLLLEQEYGRYCQGTA
jgi:uncharacterized metal-binding protein